MSAFTSNSKVRWGIGCAVALAAVMVFVAAMLDSGPVRTLILGQLKQLAADEGLVLEARQLDIDLLGAAATIDELGIGVPGETTILRSDRVSVRFHWSALLRGSIGIDSLRIEGAAVRVEVDSSGAYNLPSAFFRRQGTGRDSAISVGTVQILGDSFQWEDRRRGFDVTTGGWQLDVSGEIVHLEVGAGQVTSPQFSGPLARLRLDGRLERGGATFSLFDVGFDGLRAQAHGTIQDFDQPQFDIQAETEADLGRLNLPQQVRGLLSTVTHLEGTMGAVRLETELHGQDLSIEDLTGITLDGRASWNSAGGPLALEELTLSSREGNFRLSGEIAGGSTALSRVDVNVQGVDILPIMQLMGSPLLLSSRADGTITTSWPGLQFQVARAEGELSLREAATVASRGVMPASGHLSFDVNRDSGMFRMDDVRALGGTISGELALGLDGFGVTGEIRGAAELMSRVASNVTLLTGKDLSTVPVDGPFSVVAGIHGTLQDLQLTYRLQSPLLVISGRQLGTLDTEGSFSRGRLEIDRATLARSGQRIDIQGHADLSDVQPSFELRGGGKNIDLAQLFSTVSVAGALDLDVAMSGDIRQPSAVAEFSVSQMAVDEELLGNVTGHSTLDWPSLRIDSISLKRSNPDGSIGELNSSGLYEVLSGEYAINAEAQNLSFQRESMQATFGGRLEGHGKVSEAAPFTAVAEISADTTGPPSTRILFSAGVQASGDMKNLRETRASAAISDMSIGAGDVVIRNEGDVNLLYGDGRIEVQQGALRLGDSELEFAGSLPLEQPDPDAGLSIRGAIPLATLQTFLPVELLTSASGIVRLDGTIRGTVREIQPALAFDSEAAYFEFPWLPLPLSEVTIHGAWQKGTIVLEELRGEWAGAQFEAAGAIPLETSSGSGTGSGVEFALRGLSLARTGIVPEGVEGTLNLTARVGGSTAGDINGTVEFQELRGSYGGLEVRQRHNVQLSLADGKVRIDSLELTGPQTEVTATGEAELGGSRQLNLQLRGDTDARLLSLLAGPSVVAGGATSLAISVTGSTAAPQIAGSLDLSQGSVSLGQRALRAESVNLGLDFTAGQVSLRELTGRLNGGTFSAGGRFRYSTAGVEDTDLRFEAKDVFLEFPAGMRTQSDADITVSGGELLQVGGEVRIQGGSYTRDILADQLVRTALSGGPAPEIPQSPNPLLAKVRYNVAITTAAPVVIDSNIGRAGAEADLRLAGSYYRPGLTGRINLYQGGTLQFGGNRYVLDSGSIEFVSTSGIRPVFDIQAGTRVGGKTIDAHLRGGGNEEPSINLQSPSDPDLTQPDLLSLLLTGQTREQLRGRESSALAHQSLLLLTGGLAGGLSSNLRRTLGTSVRLEPNVITAESEPSSRLTVQQEFGSRVNLLYSLNLQDSTDEIWVLEYILNRFSTRAIRQSDNSTRAELGYSKSFGGEKPSKTSQPESARISSIQIAGTTGLPVRQLENGLRSRAGKRLSVVKVSRDEVGLRDMLNKSGYLEATVTANREISGDSADLTFEVEAGPILEISCAGFPVSGRLLKRLRESWKSGTFEAQRSDDARREILGFLTDKGYVQATVVDSVELREDGVKSVRFDIDAGPRYLDVRLVFRGNRGLSATELEQALHGRDRRQEIHSDPPRTSDYLADIYRTNGYLDARVGPIQLDLDTERKVARILVPIEEGPLYRIQDVVFQGNRAANAEELLQTIGFRGGQEYHPRFPQFALSRIEEYYWDLGYQDVVVDFRMTKDTDAGTVLLGFDIQENQQAVLRELQVAGNDFTSAGLIRSQLGLEPGDPLRSSELAEARTRLYNTGSFSLVDLETHPVESQASSQIIPIDLSLRVREVRPYDSRFAAFYDSSNGFGGVFDFVTRNIVGNSRSLGSRLRYDGEIKEARVYMNQPFLRRLPVQGTVLAYAREEDDGDFRTSRFGISAQQQTWWLDKKYTASLGIRYEWAETDTPNVSLRDSIPNRDRQRVAPVTFSFARDTRDGILNATEGSFALTSFEYAPKFLGSEEEFMSGFAQYARYIPLARPSAPPSGGDLPAPRLVYALSGRAGAAWGLKGGSVPFSQRFFAGGGTSIRGFKQDSVGPVAATGEAIGGESLFILNNEIRLPLFSWLDGVGFLDAGNVYAEARDFDPFDLRTAAGLGFRLRFNSLLLRLDYGFKLNRRTGESTGAFFFSIGQAF